MQINLLSPRSANVRQTKAEGVGLVLPLVAATLIIASFLATFVLYALNYSANQRLIETKEETANLTKVETAEKVRTKYRQVNETLQAAQQAITAANPQYTKYLDALTRILPREVFLKQIAVDGQPWKMVLKGTTSSHQVVAQLGMQLRNEPLLRDSHIEVGGSTDKGYEFQITVQGGGK